MLPFSLTWEIEDCISASKKNKARLQLIAENTAKEKVRSEALKKKEERYQSDEYIEEIAREKLGLVYPDEIILKPGN